MNRSINGAHGVKAVLPTTVEDVDVKRLIADLSNVTPDTPPGEMFEACFAAFVVLDATFNGSNAGGAE